MKKINITPKAKKVIMFTTMAVVCIGIITLVFSVTAKSALESADTSSVNLVVDNGSSDLSIPPIEHSSSVASEAPAFVPSSGASQSAQLTVISKPTATPPKPTVSSALTNKNSKPSYTSKPTVSSKATTSRSSSSTPKAGDTKDGKSYMPGFGWVDGTGGGQGTVVSGMREGGSQVGIMD